MNTQTARKINCHKCRGTGVIERFLDVHDGVCFDCDGSGKVAHIGGGRGRVTPIEAADLEIGLRVRARTQGASDETITSFNRHPALSIVTVVTTDAGNEYWVNPNLRSPLVLA